jgi:hypothetical protein
VVTNAYAYPAKKPSQIPHKRDQKALGRQIFLSLVQLCEPKAILFYGAEAIELGSETFSVTLDPYTPLPEQRTAGLVDGSRKSVSLRAYPHFSGQGVQAGFQVSKMDSDLESLAAMLKEQFGAT